MRFFWKYCPLYFAWTLHNLFGHPISEIAALLKLPLISNYIHDITLPPPEHEAHRDSRG